MRSETHAPLSVWCRLCSLRKGCRDAARALYILLRMQGLLCALYFSCARSGLPLRHLARRSGLLHLCHWACWCAGSAARTPMTYHTGHHACRRLQCLCGACHVNREQQVALKGWLSGEKASSIFCMHGYSPRQEEGRGRSLHCCMSCCSCAWALCMLLRPAGLRMCARPLICNRSHIPPRDAPLACLEEVTLPRPLQRLRPALAPFHTPLSTQPDQARAKMALLEGHC
jgi:hypothetical protein